MKEDLILVTGATGFIGRRVSVLLAREGIPILATGRSAAALEELARECAAGGGRVETCVVDWTDPAEAAAIPRRWPGITQIVHLASPVPGADGDNIAMMSAGCAQTLNVLQMADQLPVRHLTYMSSVAVYGREATGCIDESTPWLEDVGPYGQMKRICEELVQWWGRERKLPVAVLRPSQVYGPGEPHGLGLSRMVRSALAGETLTLQNGGQDIRDLAFVDDVAGTVVAAARHEVSGTFNISSGTGHTVRQMSAAIEAAIGAAMPVDVRPVSRAAAPSIYSNAAAVKALGLRPTSLEAGVAAAVAAERANQGETA